jgi:hypothetical protein
MQRWNMIRSLSRRRNCHGGRFRGNGWPATFEFLSPLDTEISDPRHSFKVAICQGNKELIIGRRCRI